MSLTEPGIIRLDGDANGYLHEIMPMHLALTVVRYSPKWEEVRHRDRVIRCSDHHLEFIERELIT